MQDFKTYGASRACVLAPLTDSGNSAILGNSHAQMYAEAIVARHTSGRAGVLLVPLNGCMPTLTINISRACITMAQNNFAAVIADPQITRVIIGTTYISKSFVDASGIALSPAATQNALPAALIDLVEKLEASGRRAWLIGPVLGPGYDLPSELSRKLRFGHITEDAGESLLAVPRARFDVQFGSIVSLLRHRLGHRLLLPHERICDANLCYFAYAEGSNFADSNYLGRHGIATVLPVFEAFSLEE